MTFIAVHPGLTSGIFKRLELLLKIPELTFLSIIAKLKRIPPKILYIMRIDTARPIMPKRVRTPNRLILLQIKIIIFIQQMDHLDLDLSLRMGKSTKLLIIAFNILICVSLAEF